MTEHPEDDPELARWSGVWTAATAPAPTDPVLKARRAMRWRRLRLWLGAGLSVLSLQQLVRFGVLQGSTAWWLWSVAMGLFIVVVQVLALRIELRNREALVQDAESARRWMTGNAEAGLRLARQNLIGTVMLIPGLAPLVWSLVRQDNRHGALVLCLALAAVILGSLLWSWHTWRQQSRVLRSLRSTPEPPGEGRPR